MEGWEGRKERKESRKQRGAVYNLSKCVSTCLACERL